MKKKLRWAIALAPLMLVGCAEQIEVGPKASSGDDVLFMVENTSNGTTRTMYQNNWDSVDVDNNKTPQAIYWGNYLKTPEYINIYCPDTERGFAKYEVTPNGENPDVAATVVKISDIGVQWGAQNTAHTFYAFYPADKAGETLDGGNTIVATVDGDQSPQMYKQKETAEKDFNTTTFKEIVSFEDYNKGEYDSDNNKVSSQTSRTIYGMPDMSAAVMMAKTQMAAGDYGGKVPLNFSVLADVLDLTFNGPVSPNTLGGNANNMSRSQIKIQSVTIDVVNPVEITSADKRQEEIAKFEIDNTKSISGSFRLNMAEGLVTEVTDGKPTVTLETSMGGGNPTLFVRKEIGDNATPTATDIDHLRLRAFLIPGQITGENLNKLRIHIQTDCGDFYEMLKSDSKFVDGKIYPVKLGYFKKRGEEFDITKWISQLDPDIYLSELSIPGAWHAANIKYQGNHTLKEMYEVGVRAFEVHTKNGPVLRKYGDMDTEFSLANETENFEDPFVVTDYTDYNYTNYGTPTVTGNSQTESNTIDGTTYNRSRQVTATATVTRIKSENVYTVPKFWIRLYRTNENPASPQSTPLSQAIINLAETMNPTGLLFLEMGMDGQTAIDKVPYRSKEANTIEQTATNVSIKGKEWGTYRWGSTTWPGVYSNWEIDGDAQFNDVQGSENTTTDTNGTFTLNGNWAWAIAIRSCLERLLTTTNPNTNKPILYNDTLTAYTTIKDVQGQVIAKVNTNDDDNEYQFLYGTKTPTPALFSRWIDGSANKPLTINLQWKSPVAPYVNGVEGAHHEGLRWCYTELDNITNISARENAIMEMNNTASTNYAGGRHRTFYETCLGGFDNYTNYVVYPSENDITDTKCQNVAKRLHPYVLERLNNPTRKNVPMGLVFMNYVIPPTGEEDTYKSAELIRAIVNNNKAFRLHRITDGK